MLARSERLHSQFFHIAQVDTREVIWEPPADVLETRRHVVVIFGLPGVDPEAVSTAIEGGTLHIKGERSLPRELGRIFIHRMELPTGPFERRVILPRGRYGDAEIATGNGCLVVTLRKVF